MHSQEMRWTIGAMVMSWFAWAGCGGSSTDGSSGGSAGANAAGAAGSTVATGTGGGGGSSSTGTGGAPGVNDAGRTPCGTANNGLGCNPNGNNRICDLANNRCVQCTSDTACAANPNQPGNVYCDTVGTNAAGLPNDTCEECLLDSHCATGMACVNNNCVQTCTTDAECAASPMTPVCNTAAMPGQCVQCLSDTQCAGVVDGNGVPRPHCRLAGTQNANQCRACNTTTDCQPGETCSNGGNCNVPMDGGFGREGGREGGRGGLGDASLGDAFGRGD
jgi:Cys-rich repeat protein